MHHLCGVHKVCMGQFAELRVCTTLEQVHVCEPTPHAWCASRYPVMCNEQTHGRHIAVNTHMTASMELAMMQVAKTDPGADVQVRPNTQRVLIWVRPDPWHDWIYGQHNSRHDRL